MPLLRRDLLPLISPHHAFFHYHMLLVSRRFDAPSHRFPSETAEHVISTRHALLPRGALNPGLFATRIRNANNPSVTCSMWIFERTSHVFPRTRADAEAVRLLS